MTYYTYTIVWPHAEDYISSIEVTGNFDNWSLSTRLTKNANGDFTAVIKSPKYEKLVFKFIVNGNEWLTHDAYGIAYDDSGLQNNYVDAEELTVVEENAAYSQQNKQEKQESEQNQPAHSEKQDQALDQPIRSEKQDQALPIRSEKQEKAQLNQPIRSEKSIHSENPDQAQLNQAQSDQRIHSEKQEKAQLNQLIHSEKPDQALDQGQEKQRDDSPDDLTQISTSESSFAAVSIPGSTSHTHPHTDNEYEHVPQDPSNASSNASNRNAPTPPQQLLESEDDTPATSVYHSTILQPNDSKTTISTPTKPATPAKPSTPSTSGGAGASHLGSRVASDETNHYSSGVPGAFIESTPSGPRGKRDGLISKFKGLFKY